MKKSLILACAFLCMNAMNASAATRYAADDEKKENVTSVSETAGTDMTWEFILLTEILLPKTWLLYPVHPGSGKKLPIFTVCSRTLM